MLGKRRAEALNQQYMENEVGGNGMTLRQKRRRTMSLNTNEINVQEDPETIYQVDASICSNGQKEEDITKEPDQFLGTADNLPAEQEYFEPIGQIQSNESYNQVL